jgi:DNA-directed RNA polymerase specialized sigma24 family protein
LKHLEDFDLPRSEWERLINEWIIGKNAERDREMLRRRLFDGLCFEELAEEFCLSTAQAKTVIYKAMQRLIRHI